VSILLGNNFSRIITDRITDLNSLEAGAQCFPLYWYEKKGKSKPAYLKKRKAAISSMTVYRTSYSTRLIYGTAFGLLKKTYSILGFFPDRPPTG
jgi:predicted helicase